jgi:hypothetical protein
LAELQTAEMQPMLLNRHGVTVIFGAGGLFREFFAKLFKMGHHVLSYQFSEGSPWPDGEFRSQDVKLLNGQFSPFQFAERALPLAEGVSFRELRCRTGDGRQIVVISSDRELDLNALAGTLLVELSSVRFLDHLRVHSALDALCEGIVGPAEETAKAGNEAVTPRSLRPFGPHNAAREFVSAIKLMAFRAENMISHILRERVPQSDKAVIILRHLLNSPADLVPDLRHQTLTVRLRPQILDGCEEALRHLCSELNPTETVFPATDMRLVYEVGSSG